MSFKNGPRTSDVVRRLEAENARLLKENGKLRTSLQTTFKTLRSDAAPEHELIAAMRLILKATPVRSGPGVYFLIDDTDEVVYIGQSSNVASRLQGHADKSFLDIRMVRVDRASERLKVEALLIKAMQPKYNVTHNVAALQLVAA